MRKKTKALSGASQDAYFRRVLKANPNLSADERDQLVRRLRAEVAQLRVRMEPRLQRDAQALQMHADVPAQPEAELQVAADAEARPEAALRAAVEPIALPDSLPSAAMENDAALAQTIPQPVAEPAAQPFDPFSPNIVVVVRKSGRDAALAALSAIDNTDDLRLLAREQRLSVQVELCSADELRAAIVTAAERRIANRMAAAG
jgi:hypothetical protein